MTLQGDTVHIFIIMFTPKYETGRKIPSDPTDEIQYACTCKQKQSNQQEKRKKYCKLWRLCCCLHSSVLLATILMVCYFLRSILLSRCFTLVHFVTLPFLLFGHCCFPTGNAVIRVVLKQKTTPTLKKRRRKKGCILFSL